MNSTKKSFHTLNDIIHDMKTRSASSGIMFKERVEWKTLSWPEVATEIEAFAYALAEMGVQKGDRVALMSASRPEWLILDFACQLIGAITVPIYQNSTAEEMKFILNHCEASTLLLESTAAIKQWNDIRSECPAVKSILCFETNEPQNKKLQTYHSVLERGKNLQKEHPNDSTPFALNEPDDACSIIYTSGTTGQPKGVLLTHRQALSEVNEAFPLFQVTAQDKSLSFLPYAHILGRIEMWGAARFGFTLAFAQSIEKIKENLVEVQPTMLVAVPRIFEKIYSGIYSQIENQPLKKKLFEWALRVTSQVHYHQRTKQVSSLKLIAEYEIAQKTVFKKVQEAFGGKLRFAISGGAPLQKEIAEFFASVGLLILEGYGLTETTAAITVNTPRDYKFGTVGKPIGDVEVKIASDGEILVKSAKVMKEYYKNPEETQKVLRDGWFSTGDIGELTPDGFLKILDRKKDLIKTSGGKYVAPQKIEALFKTYPLISNVVVHGDHEKYIVLLITLDRLFLEKQALANQKSFANWLELIELPETKTTVEQIVVEVNSKLASWETIKNYKILQTEFTVESNELTPSLKVKRKALIQKYKEDLDKLYE